jgi:hypothetical protein
MEQLAFDYHAAMREGHRYNEIVAMRFRSEGIGCSVPSLELVSTVAEIKRMTDNDKDIILDNGKVIEVKSRNRRFTEDPQSFPFDELMVDTVSGYNAKKVKPICYVVVSQITGAMLVIPGHTEQKWRKQKAYDQARGHSDTFLLVHKNSCKTWKALIEHLKGE